MNLLQGTIRIQCDALFVTTNLQILNNQYRCKKSYKYEHEDCAMYNDAQMTHGCCGKCL